MANGSDNGPELTTPRSFEIILWIFGLNERSDKKNSPVNFFTDEYEYK